MRISDWSSDVCSSDLRDHVVGSAIPAVTGEHRVLALEREIDRDARIGRIGLPTARSPGERALEVRRENDPASTKAGQLRFEAIESSGDRDALRRLVRLAVILLAELCLAASPDRKSTRLNSSH